MNRHTCPITQRQMHTLCRHSFPGGSRCLFSHLHIHSFFFSYILCARSSSWSFFFVFDIQKTTACTRDKNNKAAQRKKEFLGRKLGCSSCTRENPPHPKCKTPHQAHLTPSSPPLPLQRKWDMLMKLAGLSWLKTKHFGTCETSEWVRQPGGKDEPVIFCFCQSLVFSCLLLWSL